MEKFNINIMDIINIFGKIFITKKVINILDTVLSKFDINIFYLLNFETFKMICRFSMYISLVLVIIILLAISIAFILIDKKILDDSFEDKIFDFYEKVSTKFYKF